jgi:hypothetical protein
VVAALGVSAALVALAPAVGGAFTGTPAAVKPNRLRRVGAWQATPGAITKP